MGQMSKKRTIAVMVGVLTGMFFSSLNQTLIGTALPKIISHLGGMNLYSWVFTSFMLTSTTAVPIFGKLSDIYGRRPFYLWGLIVFMTGSALCGFSREMWELIIFRGVQGLGAGMLMANSMAVVGDIFTPAERGRWQGVMGAVFGLSSVIGPTLGGYITDYLNWRWVFFVNLPVGVLALALLYVVLPKIKLGKNRPKVDFAGLTFLITAVVPLLLALTWGGKDYAWNSLQIIGLLGSSAVSVALFLLAESRAPEPIIPLSLFRSKIFVVSSIIVFLTGIGMFGTTMFIPLFVQGVIGSSATQSGLVLMPMMLSMVLASTISGQIISRTGRYKMLTFIGIFIMAVGMYLLSAMDTNTTNSKAIINMIVVGFGLGVTMPLFVIMVQNAFPKNQLGVVTAAVQFFRSIGGTLGVAVMGTFMNTTFSSEMATSLPADIRKMVGPDKLSALLNPQVLINPESLTQLRSQLPQAFNLELDKVVMAVKTALAFAIHDVFLFGFAVIVLSFFFAFFIQEIPLKTSHDESTGEVGGRLTPQPSEH